MAKEKQVPKNEPYQDVSNHITKELLLLSLAQIVSIDNIPLRTVTRYLNATIDLNLPNNRFETAMQTLEQDQRFKDHFTPWLRCLRELAVDGEFQTRGHEGVVPLPKYQVRQHAQAILYPVITDLNKAWASLKSSEDAEKDKKPIPEALKSNITSRLDQAYDALYGEIERNQPKASHESLRTSSSFRRFSDSIPCPSSSREDILKKKTARNDSFVEMVSNATQTVLNAISIFGCCAPRDGGWER